MNNDTSCRKLHIGRAISLLLSLALLLVPLRAGRAAEGEIPKPENVTVHTTDGVVLHCTWYAGTQGKDTIPVILLHGWGGQRSELDGLATFLQRKGHAVIVPDLRGHGASTTQRLPQQDRDRRIDQNTMRLADFQAMVLYDVEATKKFLMEKNNAAELNIELLTVVGFDMGSVIALNWCLKDWLAPPLAGFKQGQDVKAFVLVSPEQSFKGLTTRDALANRTVSTVLSAMVIVGSQDRRALGEARRIHTTLERNRPKVPDDPRERIDKQDLFFIPVDTTLQGTKLLRGFGVEDKIAGFIQLRIKNKASQWPWRDRTGPLR